MYGSPHSTDFKYTGDLGTAINTKGELAVSLGIDDKGRDVLSIDFGSTGLPGSPGRLLKLRAEESEKLSQGKDLLAKWKAALVEHCVHFVQAAPPAAP